jgi:hypothetical protein
MFIVCITDDNEVVLNHIYSSYNDAKNGIINICKTIFNDTFSLNIDSYNIDKKKLIHETISTECHTIAVIVVVNLEPSHCYDDEN